MASDNPARALYLMNLLNQGIVPEEGVELRSFLHDYSEMAEGTVDYRPIWFTLTDIKEIGLPMVASFIKAILHVA